MTVKTYKELSLKQREQRLGYLETYREKVKKAEVIEDFQKIFSND